MSNIFAGLKVIDLTRVFSGPFATRHLADYGAEVIKIEPLTGDDSRNFEPLIGEWSGYFEVLNRNKSSMRLDLKNEKQLKTFYELCRTADVVVENYSPAVKKRLKISYHDLKAANPKLIYASLIGISNRIDRKYYDVIAQAESGLASLSGTSADMKIATSVTDAFAGMKLAFAIVSALYARATNQKGCQITVSMLGSTFDLLEQNLIQASLTRQNPPKIGNMDNAIAPFGIFSTKDSSVALAIGNDRQWQQFCEFFSHDNEHLKKSIFQHNSDRILHISELEKAINTIFCQFTTKEVIEKLHAINVPCGQCNKMLDVLGDRQNFDEGLLQTIHHPKVGSFVVANGGISFSRYFQKKYRYAPQLAERAQ